MGTLRFFKADPTMGTLRSTLSVIQETTFGPVCAAQSRRVMHKYFCCCCCYFLLLDFVSDFHGNLRVLF